MDSLDPIIEAFGERKTLYEWSRDRRSMVSHLTLAARVDAGWSVERAITTPQVRNLRQHEKPLVAFGECKTLVEWSLDPRAQAPARTILWRVRRGWKPEDAITEPAAVILSQEKVTRRAAPKLFQAFGTTNTLRGWLEDPRCIVNREKLLRNLGEGMTMEQAMTTGGEDGRRTRNRIVTENAIEGIDEALKLLSAGAELWHAQTSGGSRSSLIKGNLRREVGDEIVQDLIARGYVELTFDTPTIAEYRISLEGKRAAG